MKVRDWYDEQEHYQTHSGKHTYLYDDKPCTTTNIEMYLYKTTKLHYANKKWARPTQFELLLQ